MPERSSRLDRVSRPDPTVAQPRDGQGKEALYSTAPTASPSAQVLLWCERCDVEKGVSVLGLARALTPPVLYNPVTRRIWARCPSCRRRSWLDVRSGQVLRVLWDRLARRDDPSPR